MSKHKLFALWWSGFLAACMMASIPLAVLVDDGFIASIVLCGLGAVALLAGALGLFD